MADINNTKYYSLIKAPGTRPLFPPEMEEPQPVINPNLPGLLVNHNATLNKQGGDPDLDEFYHLSKAQYDELGISTAPIIQVFTYSTSNVFSLSDPNPTIIYVALNGQVLTEGSIKDYTVSGTQLTINSTNVILQSADEITVLYYTQVPRISLYGRNIDGGAPDSVYLPIQNVDGGTP